MENTPKPQLLFRYRETDGHGGVTRQTVQRMGKLLVMDETQTIHHALKLLAEQILPRYEQDEGPLTDRQAQDIQALAGSPRTTAKVKSSLL